MEYNCCVLWADNRHYAILYAWISPTQEHICSTKLCQFRKLPSDFYPWKYTVDFLNTTSENSIPENTISEKFYTDKLTNRSYEIIVNYLILDLFKISITENF